MRCVSSLVQRCSVAYGVILQQMLKTKHFPNRHGNSVEVVMLSRYNKQSYKELYSTPAMSPACALHSALSPLRVVPGVGWVQGRTCQRGNPAQATRDQSSACTRPDPAPRLPLRGGRLVLAACCCAEASTS